MNEIGAGKLTLPIQNNKRYICRDGKIVRATHVGPNKHPALSCIGNGDLIYTATGKGHWNETFQTSFDLMSDHDESLRPTAGIKKPVFDIIKPSAILELPIELGKKYIRRDGKIVQAAYKVFSISEHYTYVDIECRHAVNNDTGMYHSGNVESAYDLISNFFESTESQASEPKAVIPSIPVSALDADNPWEQCEYMNSQTNWRTCAKPFYWGTELHLRQKPKLVLTQDINGYKVPMSMSAKPEIGTQVWVVDLAEQYRNDFIWGDCHKDNSVLESGVCHLTKDAAMIHTKALLSFMKPKA